MPEEVDDAEARDRREYLEFRKPYEGLGHEASKSFDQAMLALAAGSLGLSVTFVKEIARTPAPHTRGFLYSSWAFFCISIVAMLFSLLAAQELAQARITDLDRDALRKLRRRKRRYRLPPRPIRRVLWLGEEDPWAELVDRMNYGSILSFIVGAMCFMAFSSFNLNGEHTMAETPESNQPQPIERGHKASERPAPAPPPRPAAPSNPPPKTK